MRKLSLLFFFTCIALPAFAAKHITVEQLEQVLSTVHDRPDAEVARQLTDLELIERFNSVKLAHWISALSGEDARHALIALADASADLDPPAAEIPSRPAPDLAEQRRMLALTVAYVSKTIPQLPNFFATRQTARFEDTPQLQSSDFFVPYQPLHRVDSSSATVLYRDGIEAVDTGSSKKPPPMTAGLATKGVFGPILATVLLDAAQSKLSWKRWEQGSSGPQAVFSYTVPKEQSHYEVTFCCVAEQAATNVANMYPFRRVVGYHGEMAVDPATGTILRLVVEADLKPSDPVIKAAITVEYGPVEIGGKTYFCPVKSVSKALAQTVQLDPVYKFPLANQLQPLKNSLSDVAFEDYHVFRAEARVLAGEVADQTPPPASSGSADAATAAAGPAPANANTPETASATAPASVPSASAAVPPPAIEAADAAAPAPAPEPAVPEITVADATTVPDAASNPHPTASGTGFTLRTTARLVDVGVVAYDKKGHPVTDLKPEDFELYDNGRKQEIRFFGQAGQTPVSPSAAPQSASDAGGPVYTNRPAVEPAGQPHPHPSAAEGNATILLIDAANLAWGDLSYARGEMLRFLKTLPADDSAGLYILRSLSFQALAEPTADHALVIDKLAHWMPTAQDLARAQDEEQRNRQHFEYVHSIFDLPSVNGNGNTDPSNFVSGKGWMAQEAAPTDSKLQLLGSSPERDALFNLAGVARHLAPIPGHKDVVWVSSDNVLADWSNQVVARQDKGNKFIDPLALRAQEALNDAHASIYPLDASQLEAGGVAADTGTRNVLAMGYSDRSKALTDAVGDAAPGMKPGRQTAQMQQDTHPIQGAFRDLADATGGRVFRRSGSIANELDSVVDDGRATWLLAFTPAQPADDKYHSITVKLNGMRDVTLHYRTGYQYNKEPATMKDRFRQAIWQPADVTEVALTANSLPDATGATLKLNIAATDLDLAQQNDLWLDKLDIFLVERDEAELHAQVTGQQLGLRLKPATYQRLLREGVSFEVKVKAHPDIGSIRIVAVDENSGRMGSVTIPAAILTAKP